MVQAERATSMSREAEKLYEQIVKKLVRRGMAEPIARIHARFEMGQADHLMDDKTNAGPTPIERILAGR